MESFRYFKMLNNVVETYDFPPYFFKDSQNSVEAQGMGDLEVRAPLHPSARENGPSAWSWS